MKKHFFLFIITILSFLYGCQPLTVIQIETLEPASIDFPGNFNKLIFINADTDINNDEKTDTVLYNLITKEMNLGFLEAIRSTASIDTTDYLYVKGFPNRNLLYFNDTISWSYLERISGSTNADLFIILDSIKITMGNESYVDYMAYPTLYYQTREMAVNAYWSIFDLVERKRLDRYRYSDTLYWEKSAYTEAKLNKEMPSLEKCLREMSFFVAFDYGKRVLPSWDKEGRYYFELGNKDFKLASQLIRDEDNWDKAIELWLKYVDNFDREIASRACFNLALAYEIKGNFDLAIKWAEQSKKIKNKTKTKYYISILEDRKKDLEKLQKQL